LSGGIARKVLGRLMVHDNMAELVKVRVTGKGPVPQMEQGGPLPIRPGQLFPALQLTLQDGSSAVLGSGQDRPTALAFVYTRCPMPGYCPATVARLQALQAQLGPAQRIVTITLDPDFDTVSVLAKYAQDSGANPAIWSFARLDHSPLPQAAILAGMPVAKDQTGTIVHALRLLVLGADGRLIERYDDNNWPLGRVAQQLKTGGPHPPAGSLSTETPTVE